MPHKTYEASRAYWVANRERINAQRRRRYQESPDALLTKNQKWRVVNQPKITSRRRLKVFGTDGEQMYAAQQGRCAICDVVMERKGRRRYSAHLDHDHGTGRVRGWLCSRCNLGIGGFEDDATLLQKAVNYLKAYKP